MMTQLHVELSRYSLVVYVGLSSLGGHIDNDTDLTLVFIQLDLNVMLIVS